MARLIYSLVLWLALPLVLLRLLWRARRQDGYLAHLGERFGRYDRRPSRPVIWLHAVSVGETRAAQPLLDALSTRHPDCEFLLTCMTPTGRAAAQSLRCGALSIAYLPYDYGFAVRRFIRHFRPRVGLILETEVWPNLLALCSSAGVPLALVNARLSVRSQRRYLKFRALASGAFRAFSAIAAQSDADRVRIAALGARSIAITGNLKFDAAPAPELLALGRGWRASLGARRVVLAASTREGEESLLLAAFKRLAGAGHLVVLVPRHPQRFDEVGRLMAAAGLKVSRRSVTQVPDVQADVWLGDSMGEMAAYYALADCAYVGGSLLPFGGQNLIEAAACGCPVLIGPHTWNFAEAAEAAVAAGAAAVIADAEQFCQATESLLENEAKRAAMAQAGVAFAAAHRGATARTMAIIEPLLPLPG